MKLTVGFIGCGNMGGALALACAKSAHLDRLLLSDLFEGTLDRCAQATGGVKSDNETIVKTSDIIVLAVKPQGYKAVIDEIAPFLSAREKAPLVISIAAGITIAQCKEMGIPAFCPIIRIMPNLPVSVGEGMILYTCSKEVADLEVDFIELFRAAGRFSQIPEDKIDAASAVSGCGPAFVCLFIEALADGAVACGLGRKDAMTFAEQTLLGTAKQLMETHMHPAMLKDAVCSPGGTTIQGVRALEQNGFRTAAMEAVIAAYEKTLALKNAGGK